MFSEAQIRATNEALVIAALISYYDKKTRAHRPIENLKNSLTHQSTNKDSFLEPIEFALRAALSKVISLKLQPQKSTFYVQFSIHR